MKQMFVLFEHAAGYALFKVNEFEETGMLLPQVEASVTDISRFNSVVKLVGFSPFKTALKALENMNSISEGILPEDLQLFLQTSLPEPDEDTQVILGVSEPKIGANIVENIPGIVCKHVGVVPEIIRGIRMHFPKLVKGFTSKISTTAQLGLSHSYSRSKVKFNVHRVDNMIIQSIALLDQLDKDINTFSMRIREWYSYHFPELYKIVTDNYTYARAARFIKNRKELSEQKLEELEEIVMDSAKAQAILDASKSSMGMDISPMDLINIELFAKRVIALVEYRKQLSTYLTLKMSEVAPNLAALLGDQVAARLISHAGSLTNLAKYPASTVQILGAEKALFRALKTKGNTPKYGLLFHSSFISRAGTQNKGRISRFLANKCSIASRIDCFSDEPTNVFGEKLKQQVEDRIKFYETGTIPAKNVEVMQEAIQEAEKIIKKRQKKKRKREATENAEALNGINSVESTLEPPKKKKKKKKSAEADDSIVNGTEESEAVLQETPKKKKKKKKNKEKED